MIGQKDPILYHGGKGYHFLVHLLEKYLVWFSLLWMGEQARVFHERCYSRTEKGLHFHERNTDCVPLLIREVLILLLINLDGKQAGACSRAPTQS